MQCPFCNREMRFGHATVKGTLLSVLFYGISHNNLYFTPYREEGERSPDEMILESGEIANAWNCGECGITLIDRHGKAGRERTKTHRVVKWWEKYH